MAVKMEFIVAVDQNWAIGKDGGMLFHLPGDLAFFKRITQDSIVLMGRKTFESLPKGALPNRINVVLSKQDTFKPANTMVIHHLDELEKVVQTYPNKKVFLIGGACLYRDLLEVCMGGYVTKIEERADADVYFPDLDENSQWQRSDQLLDQGQDGSIAYQMYYYKQIKG